MKILQDAVDNFRTHMKGREYPSCFESKKQYDAWRTHELEAPTQPVRCFICRDCTKSYRNQMIDEGRCFNSDVNVIKILK